MKLDRFKNKAEAIAYLKETKKMTAKEADMYLREWIPHEKDYQKAIIRYLHRVYPEAFVWKAAAGPYTRGGIPDLCVVIEGRFFGFEVKRPYFGKISDLQKDAIIRVRAAGGVIEVVTFPEEVERIIESVIGG